MWPGGRGLIRHSNYLIHTKKNLKIKKFRQKLENLIYAKRLESISLIGGGDAGVGRPLCPRRMKTTFWQVLDL